MSKETFKDEKGTFHYEPVVWGDWKEGDKVVFEGYLLKTYYDYTLGETYTIGWEGGDLGPLDNDGNTPTRWDNKSVFKFSRKVYDVAESVENTEAKAEEKKWNEYPFSFPPVRTLALVEFDTARAEWYKGFIISHGVNEEGDYCGFEWLDGPKINQINYYYTPESFRSLLPVENKEEKDSTKQEKSLDNLLKEFHNLKQEEKELSAKVDNVLKEINSVVGLYGLSILFTNEYDMLQEND